MTRKSTGSMKLYNLLLPIWLIVFLPSPLWFLLIPANYLIDRLVLGWSLEKYKVVDTEGVELNRGDFCWKHTWKVCVAGFLSDFVGAIILLVVYLKGGESGSARLSAITDALCYNPFQDWAALMIAIASVLVTAILIYLIDRVVVYKAMSKTVDEGLAKKVARHSALMLAILTAPYIYLFPMTLIYK